MSNIESKLISAVCENKDISSVMSADVDHMFISHRDVWEGLKSYYMKYKSVPTVDVLAERYRHFEPDPISSPTKYYVDSLRESYINTTLKGAILDAGKSLNTDSATRVLEKLQAEIADLSRSAATVGDINIVDYSAAQEYYDSVRMHRDDNDGTVGIMTGLKAFDAAVPTGFAPGNLVILLGYSGRGKTWLSGYFAKQAFLQGKKPMVISMEMTAEAMRDRIYATMADGTFYVSDFQTGSVDTDDFRSWGKKNLADRQGFTIVSSEGLSDITVNTIQAKIDQHQPDMVVIDYIQLMSDAHGARNETEKVRNISRDLKRLALRNNIPVLAISAVTSADLSAPDSPPMLEQVSWSRSIQFDADLAVAIHKYDDTNIVECVSRKNRSGPDFCVYLDVDFSRGIIRETTEGV